ncbi:MAG: DUF6445 family protein [Pseudomonadota bacterium]
MFNPAPRIELLAIAGHKPCIVVDDFLLDPEAMVDAVARARDGFAPAPLNAYPGIELPAPDALSAQLDGFFMQHVRQRLGARRTVRMHSRLSIVTLAPQQLQPLQRVCHRDRLAAEADQSVAAAVVYLFRDPALGGTSFYAPRQGMAETERLITAWNGMGQAAMTEVIGAEPGYLVGSNRYFELLATVPAKFNRAIFYDGSMFHSSHVTRPELLNADPAQGRLTLNGFFVCRNAAASQ